MIGGVITIDSTGIDRAEKVLAHIPNGAERAIYNAMERATKQFRKRATEKIQERYAISGSDLRSNESMKLELTRGNPVKARIRYDGSKIPLIRYSGSGPKSYSRAPQYVHIVINDHWVITHPSAGGARGHQLKSTAPTTFGEGYFVAAMRSGHVGIFQRTGDKTASGANEIEQKMGNSIPEMVGNEEVSTPLLEESMDKFSERLDHEISRLLAGG